ncbi:MAG: hypothetical protein LBT50_03445 [Prevotellaceae bacterium]|jgi:hypothetical protein|nr:hypothetical protein [Prevotellaceae bacterium]
MKKFFYLFVAIIIASCSAENDNEEFYESFGVVKENGDASGKFHIRSDNGKVIVPTSGLLSLDDKGRRVWLVFLTDSNIESDTIKANVYKFIRVTEMDLKNEFDEQSSDVVNLNSIWTAQNYLTLMMSVRANSETSLENHKYTMYSDLELRNDTLQMEFKYDDNNDSYGTVFNKIVALKLDQLPSPNQNSADSVVLAIKYRSADSDRVAYLKYKKE